MGYPLTLVVQKQTAYNLMMLVQGRANSGPWAACRLPQRFPLPAETFRKNIQI